jgi:putative FmdB family regulatory protein
MPFYEYECPHCKFYTEVMQKISAPPLKKCPSCGKSSMKKLVSAPNFRLKGGGWYETDFKSDKENKRNLAADPEPEAKKAPEPKVEAKPVESKPAPVSEPKPVERRSTAKTSAKKAKTKSKVAAGRRRTRR